MDIKKLKAEVRKYITAMETDGKTFSFVALIPTYPGVSDSSYILQVKADWIEQTYCKVVFDYMIPKMFKVLEPSTRMFINRIDIFDKNGSLHCISDDLILINEIGYKPEKYLQFSEG